MTEEFIQAWIDVVRAEHRAQVHKTIAEESRRTAIKAQRRYEEMCDREPASAKCWPFPMSDSGAVAK